MASSPLLDALRVAIRPEDLRVTLPRLCRYNGAIDVRLDVHLVLTGRLAQAAREPVEVVCAAGGHDAHEGYMPDLHPALKALLPLWRFFEDRWERHVAYELGIPTSPAIRERVKAYDLLALRVEMYAEGHPGRSMLGGGAPDVGAVVLYHEIRRMSPGERWAELCRMVPGLKE